MKKAAALLSKLMISIWEGDRPAYLPMLVIILMIWFVGFLIGMYVPTDVLSKQSILQQYVASVRFIANPQGLMGVKSNFPEISLFYHAVVCWSQPLWFLLSWKWLNNQVGVDKSGLIFKINLSITNKLVIFIFIPLWIFLSYAAFGLNHGGDTRMIAFGSSRVQLSIFGIVTHFLSPTLIAAVVFSFKRIFSNPKTVEVNYER